MRTFKYLFMGVLLLAFSAMTSVNATQYVKDKDLTAETTVAAADTITFYDDSAGNTLKATIANIFASAGNIGASTIVTVGALDSGSITSNFGNIDIGTSNFTSGGIWSIDVDGTAIGAAGSMNWGAGTDFGMYFDGTDGIISSTVDIVYSATGDDHIFKSGASNTVVATIDSNGIDIVTNDYTTGGQFIIDVDGSAIGAAGSYTFGAGSDAGIYWDGSNAFISSTADIHYSATGDDHVFLSSHVIQATIDNDGIDVITGNEYTIGDTSVLTATTLGSGVVTSSLTTVGALASGSIATGFGAIDNGVSNITSGGIWTVDVDGTALNAAGALTFGTGNDAGFFFDGTDFMISSTVDIEYRADGDDHRFYSSNVLVATIDDTGIDAVTNNITTGGIFLSDVDGTAINAAGSITFGAGNDAGIWFDGTDLEISSTTGIRLGFAAGTNFEIWVVGTETMRIDHSSNTSDTALLLYNTVDDSLIRVTVGVNHSGGEGFRALVIPNI